jgi:hypothetical protein
MRLPLDDETASASLCYRVETHTGIGLRSNAGYLLDSGPDGRAFPFHTFCLLLLSIPGAFLLYRLGGLFEEQHHCIVSMAFGFLLFIFGFCFTL